MGHYTIMKGKFKVKPELAAALRPRFTMLEEVGARHTERYTLGWKDVTLPESITNLAIFRAVLESPMNTPGRCDSATWGWNDSRDDHDDEFPDLKMVMGSDNIVEFYGSTKGGGQDQARFIALLPHIADRWRIEEDNSDSWQSNNEADDYCLHTSDDDPLSLSAMSRLGDDYFFGAEIDLTKHVALRGSIHIKPQYIHELAPYFTDGRGRHGHNWASAKDLPEEITKSMAFRVLSAPYTEGWVFPRGGCLETPAFNGEFDPDEDDNETAYTDSGVLQFICGYHYCHGNTASAFIALLPLIADKWYVEIDFGLMNGDEPEYEVIDSDVDPTLTEITKAFESDPRYTTFEWLQLLARK